MAEIATKIAFGSEERLDQAIERGDVDAFDLLLLEEQKIGWIDEDGNKVIIDGTKQILFVDALPDMGSANTIYFQNGVLYYWDGNTFIPHVGSDGINQAILDSKIEDAKNTISAHTDKLIENVKNQMNEDLADKISYNEQALTEAQKDQTRKNIGIVQADYAQNDENAADYIKNRLAWTETKPDILGELVLDSVCRPDNFLEGFHNFESDTFEVKVGSLYRITIDKYVFYSTGKNFGDATYIGDLSYLENVDNSFDNAVSTGEEILILNDMYEGEISGGDAYRYSQIIIPDIFKLDESQSTISITIQEILQKGEEIVRQIDPKYYERLAWEEKEEKIIFNQRVTPDTDTGEVVFMPSILNLEAGKSYVVKFDDVIYETVAFEIDAEGVKATCLGNAQLAFGDSSADFEPPFIIVSNYQVESNLFADMVCYIDVTNPDNLGYVTHEYDLCIIEHAETIHKIDPKYYDRIAWEEKGAPVQICPPTVFSDWIAEQTPNGDTGYFASVSTDNVPFEFVDGRTYTIVLDGMPYEVVASSASIQNTEMDEALKAVILGNADIFPMPLGVVASSSEPFFIVQAEDVLMCGVTAPGDHTFEIYETAQVIHKLDPKFYDRIAWEDEDIVEIMPENIIEESYWTPIDMDGDDNIDVYIMETPSSYWNLNFISGDEYIIVFDGVSYNCAVETIMGVFPYIGNPYVFTYTGFDNAFNNGLPFLVMQQYDMFTLVAYEQGTHSIAVYKKDKIVHKVDKRYLPEYDLFELNPTSPNYIKNKSFYEGTINLSIDELLSMLNNINIDLGSYPEYEQHAKIGEYVPHNQCIDDFKIYVKNQDEPILSDVFDFHLSEYGIWSYDYYYDFSNAYFHIIALSEEYCSSHEGLESGIYFGCLHIETKDVIDHIEVPVIKPIDSKFLPNVTDSNLITDEEIDALDASIM